MVLRFAISMMLFLVTAAFAITGCRLVDGTSSVFSLPVFEPSLSADVLRGLKSELQQDDWKQDQQRISLETTTAKCFRDGSFVLPRNYMNENLTMSILESQNRWQFGNALVEQVLAQLDESSWGEEDSSSSKKNENIGNSYLAAIARDDGIVGWNAAILWAQRDPVAAGRNPKMLALLKKLATEPSYYDPETGHVVAAPAIMKSITRANNTVQQTEEIATKKTSLNDLLQTIQKKNHSNDQKNSDEGNRVSQTAGSSDNLLRRLVDRLAPSSSTNGVHRRQISMSMRQAAAEAWCRLLATGSENPRAALAPVGRFLKRRSVPNELRAELIRGLALWIEPAAIPQLDRLFKNSGLPDGSPTLLRRAAIEACLIHAVENQISDYVCELFSRASPVRAPSLRKRVPYESSVWPKNIMDCESDPDSHVRKLFGYWLAAAGHPQAVSLIKQQFFDVDLKVRKASLISLGITGAIEAKEQLRKHAAPKTDGRHNEGIRAEAVKGLSYWGVPELERYAQDRSHTVRYAVAISVADFPTVRAGRILWNNMETATVRVQLAGVESIRDWQDELAIPLLLRSMGYGSGKAAVVAFRQLRSRMSSVGNELTDSFPLRKLQPERAVAMRKLAVRYRLPLDFSGQKSANSFVSKPETTVSSQYLQDIRIQLETLANPQMGTSHPAAIERLQQIRSEDIPLLEQLILESQAAYPPSLFDNVLAEKSAAYAALRLLNHTDPIRQRRGSQQLVQLGLRHSLSRLVVQRLLQRLRKQRDRVLWRDAMNAIMADATQESEELAIAAAFHRVPAVRIQSCHYFRRHPNPQQAEILLQLINDPYDDTVRLEAIQAAGYCRSPLIISGRESIAKKINVKKTGTKNIGKPLKENQLSGIKQLVHSPKPLIRQAAVLSLARLGDDFGERELIRMTYLPSPEIRKTAFELIGEIGSRRLVNHLIHRGWTERHYEVRKTILKSLAQIVPKADQPIGLSQANSYDEKIRLWATVK